MVQGHTDGRAATTESRHTLYAEIRQQDGLRPHAVDVVERNKLARTPIDMADNTSIKTNVMFDIAHAIYVHPAHARRVWSSLRCFRHFRRSAHYLVCALKG